MQRVTITLDDPLMAELDRFIAKRGHQNRSEAIRDLARIGLQEAASDGSERGECVAAVAYVYDHEARALPKRLTNQFHEHHDLSLSTLHVHLNHRSCMEVAVLKGCASEVRHFAEHVIAERNVHYGRMMLVPLKASWEKHRHDPTSPLHGHSHPLT